MKAIFARVRASVWALPIAKLVFAVGGLALFAALGRQAIAKQAEDPNATAASASSIAMPIASPIASVASGSPGSPDSPLPLLTVSPSSLPLAEAKSPTPESPLILNNATAEDLMRLPGIGPKKATAILALRSRLGKFHQVDDLLRVKGIGRNTLKRLRPLLRVDAPISLSSDGGSPH